MDFGKPHQIANFEVDTFSHCINSVIADLSKGDPQFWGAPLPQGYAHISSACDFTMGLGKPKRHTKFEVVSFSHCRNSKGEPQNFREPPYPMTTPTFFWVGF